MSLRASIPLLEGETHLDFEGDRLVVGRGRGADLRIPDASVAARHLVIEKRGPGYVLRAEHGVNACVLADGTHLSEGVEHLLTGSTWLAVGRVWLHFAIVSDPVPPHAKLSRQLAELLMARTLEARGEDTTPRMIVVSGKNTGDELLLLPTQEFWQVGRSDECDLVLRDVSVSRVHISLAREDYEVVAANEGGKQGTWLQGHAMAPGERGALKHGSVLRLANMELLYVDPVSRALDDLEAAADLHVDPKQVPPPPSRAPAASTPTPASVQPQADSPAPALPKPEVARARRFFSPEDLVVGVAAVAILGASVYALRTLWAR